MQELVNCPFCCHAEYDIATNMACPNCKVSIFNWVDAEKKPLYQHDCERCIFLGQFPSKSAPADLYFCATEPTLVARYSSEGSDYSSGLYPHLILNNPAIALAFALAYDKNLISITVNPNWRKRHGY